VADNVTLEGTLTSSGAVLATDDISSVHYQIVKLTFGALDSQTIASSGNGTVDAGTLRVTVASDTTGVLSVDDNGGSLTVDNATISVVGGGTEATAQRVTIANDSTGLVSVDDGGGALTTDWAGTAPPIGAGVEATALRVTLATDSTGLVSVDDNGGSLTVDNATISVAGGGTEATAQRVTIASDSTGLLSVDDNGGSLTVDNATISVVGGGTEATAQRVTIANDSTGLVSVDDGGGSLTIDGTVTASTTTGNVAHDATAAGNPVLTAARATNSIEGLTQVAATDASYLTSDLNGTIVTRNATTLEELVSERTSNTDGAATALTGAFAAGGANIHAYITSICVHNAHATTNGYVDIRDGATGSVLWTLPMPATGGAIQYFDPPLKFTANTAVAFDPSAAITTVYLSFNGFFAQG